MVITNNIKISVIVPIYNAENFLKKCINSIRFQTYRNLEIILVNDGSTDNSLEICRNLAKEDNRIVIIDKPNGGVASARNSGIENATGQYIGFVDSDDYIDEKMYKSLLEAAINNNAEIVECGYARVDTNDIILGKYPLENDITQNNVNCCRNYLLKINSTNFNVNKLYYYEIFNNIRYSNLKYSEDYLVNAKAFYSCNTKVTIKGCYYFYLNNINSASQQQFREEKFDMIRAGQKVYDYYKDRLPELCPVIATNLLDSIILIYKDLYKSSVRNKRKYSIRLINDYKYYYKLRGSNSADTIFSIRSRIIRFLFRISPRTFLVLSSINKMLFK